MKVVDVSDPSNPHIAGNFSSVITGVWAANGYVYAVSNNFGLRVLDISNLSNITQVGIVRFQALPRACR